MRMADPQRTLTPPETIPRRSDVILMGGKGVFFWLCVFFLFTIAQPGDRGRASCRCAQHAHGACVRHGSVGSRATGRRTRSRHTRSVGDTHVLNTWTHRLMTSHEAHCQL